jgi:hypothetical protein
MATIDVKNAAGATQTIQQPNANGRASAANSRPIVLSTEDAAKVPSLGQALAAASVPVVWTAAEEAQIGAVTETAPASDTASSGLNGRLQRVCQNITSLIAALAAGISVRFSARSARGRQVTTITSSTAETTIITAGSTGVFRDLFGLFVTNTSASPCTLQFRDSTGGSVQFTWIIPANSTDGFPPVASCDAIKQTTAANNWTVQCGTSLASILITAFYVEN